MRSLRATHHWRSHGHDQVWSMSGGIDRWSAEVDPSVPVY
jgi:rhodanese-related sulfurtransferase